MVKKLRRQFLYAAMLAMFLVLSIMIGAINLLNYHRLTQDADNLLAIILDNGGTFPHQMPDTAPPATDTSVSDSSTSTPPVPRDNPRLSSDFTKETPYETRYFTVQFSTAGEISQVNTGNIAAISTDDAEQLATNLYTQGRTSGFVSSYRYKSCTTDDGTLFAFVDCTRSLSSARTVLFLSILASFAGLLAVLGLLLLFSNRIFRPVAESERKQKQFITDAGHELKTPLATIDANTEVLEMLNGESEWTHSIHHQVQRMTALTKELITLSRLEEATLVRTQVNLSALLREEVRDMQARASADGRVIRTDIAPDILISGEDSKLRELSEILLDNALKYADGTGALHVTLARQGRGCQLTVSNPAFSMTDGAKPEFFERFYRSDASRSSETGGYGLGLSIAHAIVSAHGGTISASCENHRFTISSHFS